MMRATLRNLLGSELRRLKQAFWAIMLVGHLPAVTRRLLQIAAGESADPAAAGVLLLCASFIFFALKIADVRWLRFKADWRSRSVGLIVIALLHANVVQFTGEQRLAPTTVVWFHAIGMGALIGYRSLFECFRRVGEQFANPHRQLQPYLAWKIQHSTSTRAGWFDTFRTHGCRAPPLFS